MMKKYILLLITCLSIFTLAACTNESKETTAWLEGDWHSKAWNVTYEFDEDNGKWSISAGDYVLVADATLTLEEGQVLLTATDGTRYEIKKKSAQLLTFQQLAKEGAQGTTAAVEFEKVVD